METPENESENAAAVAAMETYAGYELQEIDDPHFDDDGTEDGTKLVGRFAVVPRGKELKSVKQFVDEYRLSPERITGIAQLTTVESFIDHAKRFADANSAVFADVADRANAQLISVLNYHERDGVPRFGDHRGVYKFPLSDEWKAWTGGADKPMTQAQFAQFIEDRINDVRPPDTAGDRVKEFAVNLHITLANQQRLMELSKGLTIRADIKVTQVVNLSSGEGQLMYAEAHGNADGSPLKVPGGFVIGIPVVRSGPIYEIPVRLRYRRGNDGAVVWWFTPHRIELAWDDATKEACDKVIEATNLPLFYGKPE